MFYQHSRPQPYHLSVAAIVFDSAMMTCVQHFRAEGACATSRRLPTGFVEAYQLMHESLEDDETLEAAVHRGIREEFGFVGTIDRFLGSLIASVPIGDRVFPETIATDPRIRPKVTEYRPGIEQNGKKCASP